MSRYKQVTRCSKFFRNNAKRKCMTLLLTLQVKNILCYITSLLPAHAKHVLLYMPLVSDHIIFDVVYIVNLFDVQTGEFAHNIRAV